MTPPLALILGSSERDSVELAESFARELPAVEFEPVRSARELLRALERRRASAVIARAPREGAPLPELAEVARLYPSTALLVLGDAQQAHATQSTEAHPQDDGRRAILSFLRDDVLKAARGSLSGVALPTMIQVLAGEQRTCALRVRRGRAVGSIVMRAGEIVHAEHRALSPRDAALTLLAWEATDVVFEPAPAHPERTIHDRVDFLLFEAARLQDERAQGSHRDSVAPSASATSQGSWQFPALLRGERDALLAEVLKIPGATMAELVDVGQRQVVSKRTTDGKPAPSVSPDRVASIVRSVYDMALDADTRGAMEEIVLSFSTWFKLLRPVRNAPDLVVCVAFERADITLGLAKSMLSKAIDGFGRAEG